MPVKGELEFIKELTNELTLKKGLTVEPDAGTADLLIHDQASGKMLLVEVKDAGDYGVLPISTIIPIAKLATQKGEADKILLISLSRVSSLLSRKLRELNVETLTNPTVEQAVAQIQQVFAA